MTPSTLPSLDHTLSFRSFELHQVTVPALHLFMPLQLWKPRFGSRTVGSPGKSKGNCLPEREPMDFSTRKRGNFGHPRFFHPRKSNIHAKNGPYLEAGGKTFSKAHHFGYPAVSFRRFIHLSFPKCGRCLDWKPSIIFDSLNFTRLQQISRSVLHTTMRKKTHWNELDGWKHDGWSRASIMGPGGVPTWKTIEKSPTLTIAGIFTYMKTHQN